MAGIYIHVPFCIKRCNYCNYFTTTNLNWKKKYILAVKNELKYRSETFRYPIETLYFGGGTPSTLDLNDIETVLSAIYENFDVLPEAETSFECNPDDLSLEYLKNLRNIGINRLSIGIQSFSDKDLRIMGRRHDLAQAYKAVEMSINAGFENINADIIYGLPWSSRKSYVENIEKFTALPIQHLSAYILAIEADTEFFYKKMKETDDTEIFAQYMFLCEKMKSIGMEHYEVSNFCKQDFHSRHNRAYWQEKPYLGIGAGAHSYYNGCRFFNKSDILLYNSEIFDLIRDKEILNEKEKFNEQILLGLRIIEGVDINSIKNRFPQFYDNFKSVADNWMSKNVLYLDGDRLKCYEEKWIIVDNVVEEFILV